MQSEEPQAYRADGWVLLGAAVAAAALMLHHPRGNDGGMMTPLVHGGLQLLVIGQCAIMARLARRLEWRLLAVLALAFFIAGSLAALLAATINGFVAPALASYPEGEAGAGLGLLAWELNQALARLGAIAVGTGIALYGWLLWAAGHRWLGATGMVAGLATAASLAGDVLDMHYHGAIAVYVTQLAWLALLGLALGRDRLPDARPPSSP